MAEPPTGPHQGAAIPPAPVGQPPMTANASPPTNTLAVVSIVAGVAGYVIPHPFIAGLVAIITGHMARRQVRQTGEGGSTLALIGLILGYVHLALSILLVGLILLIVLGVIGFGLFAAGHSG